MLHVVPTGTPPPGADCAVSHARLPIFVSPGVDDAVGQYSDQSGCHVSVLAAARSPLAESGRLAANLARALHKWARIMASNPPLLDRVARIGLGPAVPQPGESLPGSAPALSSGPLPGR